MKVLCSGAHGLVGRALTANLAADGHEVVAMVRPASSGAPPQGATVWWDPADGTVDDRALAAAGPYRAVVHLAGAGIGDRRWTPARRREVRDSRVASTRTLVGALRRLDPPPPVLVSGSAVGYYGDRGDEILGEDSPPGGGFLADLCREWEGEASAAEDLLRVVRVRSGVVLARHGGLLARLLPPFRLGLGARLGRGEQWTSWISLRDEVAVLRRAIDDEGLAGPVNATAPEPVTNAAFTALLARSVDRPAFLTLPAPVLELALGRGMAHEMLLAGQRVLPGVLSARGMPFADPTLEAALAGPLAPET
ncbi:MAG: TIGR01777 family oxidoreductase [Acidimicrobiales bacterium]